MCCAPCAELSMSVSSRLPACACAFTPIGRDWPAMVLPSRIQISSRKRLRSAAPAGTVLEAERRFDLMVRLDMQVTARWTRCAHCRSKPRPDKVVPVGDVADLAIEEGPVAVNRDQQSRRLIVEFNVRGQDLVSPSPPRRPLKREILLTRLPHRVGRSVPDTTRSRDRLALVVPLALALILFLLWLAFSAVVPRFSSSSTSRSRSSEESSPCGCASSPFSVSAGVGFICAIRRRGAQRLGARSIQPTTRSRRDAPPRPSSKPRVCDCARC